MEPVMRNHMKMHLHVMSKSGFVLVFALFFIIFVSCVLIGAFVGPPVIVTHVGETSNLALNWTGSITHLTKLNQQLVLHMQIHNDAYEHIGITEQVTLSISVDGGIDADDNSIYWTPLSSDARHKLEITCRKGYDFCDSVIVAHETFIAWNSYRFRVSIVDDSPTVSFITNTTFSYTYVNDHFTVFEMWVRFIFLFISVVIFIIFIIKLRHYSWRDWSVEQKWVSVLLVGTFAYNDPFFSLTILVSGWFPTFLDISMFASFLVLLLFFWLVMFDGIRQEDTQRSFLKFYLPKVIILGLFWLFIIIGFTLFVVHEMDNHSTILVVQSYIIFFQVSSLIALLAYTFWLGYIVCRACGMMSTMPFLSVRLKFFGLFTLIVLVVTIVGICFALFTPLHDTNAAEFLSFLSLLNLYVYSLAFVYLPNSGMTSEELSNRIGVATLEEDDEDLAVQTPREVPLQQLQISSFIDDEHGSDKSSTLESE